MATLEARTLFITGGSRGIGREIALRAARDGANVAIAAKTAEPHPRLAGTIHSVAAEIEAAGGRALAIRLDVRDEHAVAAAIDRAAQHFGALDILVNNASAISLTPTSATPAKRFDLMFGVNVRATFLCSQAAIPHLRAARESWIINIGSLAGKNPFPGGAAYNASKFGLIGFSEALMQEVRQDGIRVSYIMPGSVATEFSLSGAGSRTDVGDAWKIQPEDIAAIVLDLLATPARTLPSRIEVRPSMPPRK